MIKILLNSFILLGLALGLVRNKTIAQSRPNYTYYKCRTYLYTPYYVLRVMKFSFLSVRTGNITNSMLVPGTITCNPFVCFLCWTLYMCVYINTQWTTWEGSLYLLSSLSMQMFLFWYSALQILVDFISPDSAPTPWQKESAGLCMSSFHILETIL